MWRRWMHHRQEPPQRPEQTSPTRNVLPHARREAGGHDRTAHALETRDPRGSRPGMRSPRRFIGDACKILRC